MNAGLTIELGESAEHGPCPDCACKTQAVWGYVIKDGGVHAVYFVRWTVQHLERGAQMLVSIGGWGGTADSAEKRSVGVECRMGEDRPGFMVVNADDLPWSEHETLGKMLTRNAAFADGSAEEAFAILDRVVELDDRIKGFLLNHDCA